MSESDSKFSDNQSECKTAVKMRTAGWDVTVTSAGILCSKPVEAYESGKAITERWRQRNAALRQKREEGKSSLTSA